MSGASIALKFGSLIAGIGILFILFKKVKALKKFGLSGLIYVLVLSLIISSSTLILLFSTNGDEPSFLIGAQIYIVVVGILHVTLSKELIPWYREQLFIVQLILILCILLFSQFFSGLSLSYLVSSSVPMSWYLSFFWFLVPVLLYQSIMKLVEVPPKEYKNWEYPLKISLNDPTDREMENPVIISFVFKKTEESKEYTTFRAKAPVGMQLGRLFYFFINDYNSQHQESTISYVDDANESFKWLFFKVKNRIFHIKKALDPEESIYNNEIKENDILVCNRTFE